MSNIESPSVAVLLPTYNRVKYVKDAVESILAQTHQNIHLLIYDDGSTDNTIDILNQYKDKRIKIYRDDTNKGCAHARNFMMNEAKQLECDFTTFQDSDDYSNIYRLQTQINAIKDGKTMCWTKYAKSPIDSTLDYRAEPTKSSYKHYAHASVMFRTQQAIDVDLSKSGGGSDADWRRKMEDKYGKAKKIDLALYYIRFHPNRISTWRRKPSKAPKGWFKRMSY